MARTSESQRTAAARTKFAPYLGDPVGFVVRGTGGFVWSKQRDVMESVRDSRRTAVPSCHDVGKSFVASRIAAWWLCCHEPGEAFVVTTAPTFKQVKNILWREIGRVHRRAMLPGRVNQVEWLIDEELVAFGTSPADTDPAAFQGIHARYVLVIVDEACGVAKSLLDAADTLIANDESRILAIGNPDDPTSEFAEFCKPGSGWNVIRIGAFESPNFTTEECPPEVKRLLVSKTWVEEKRRKWREGSPLWQSKVLGVFPDQADDGLVPLKDLMAAISRDLEPTDESELGVDVARFGDDNTVIYHRAGPRARLYKRYNGRDTMATCGFVAQAVREIKPRVRAVKIDDAGLGGGVTDRLREMQSEGTFPKDVEIVAINVGSAPNTDDASEQYLNLRAELNWAMRDRFIAGEIDLDEREDDLVSQATQIKYKPDSRGRIVIEPKEDMKKRLDGISPDDWDALVLAFAAPSFEGSGILGWYRRKHEEKKREEKPSSAKAPDRRTKMKAPLQGASGTYYGITGTRYTVIDGVVLVEPDDVGAMKALGFTPSEV